MAQFANALLQDGVARFGCDFGKWFEHESALMHGRVGDSELRAIYDVLAEQENVDIDGAWALGQSGRAFAAELLLDLEHSTQKLSGCLLCQDGNGTVEEPRLREEFDRLSLIKRGGRLHLAQRREAPNRMLQIGFTISDVRTEGKINELRQGVTAELAGR
jgi:hypothetical protein